MNLFRHVFRYDLLTEEEMTKRRNSVLKMDFSNMSSSEIDKKVSKKMNSIERARIRDKRYLARRAKIQKFWGRLRYLLSEIRLP